ncbi:MAG: hypothetical protein B7X10_05510, partial [Burkholderiales bacterium 21-58-4]
MARTRAQRRRYQVLVSLALVATLLVLAFANDVTHAAHQARSPRRSENRSFGVLANRLITQENADDARLVYLLEHGQTLSRSVLLARLLQIAQQLPSWANDARLLRRPKIAHGLNSTIADLVTQRVNDDATILDTLAQALHLPWTPIATLTQSWVSAQQSLAQSTAAWSVARWGLVKEPGRFLLAVGDDWQSINRFAGADLSVMTRFEEWFGRGRQLVLTTTFRCTQTICDVARVFVTKNPSQFEKPMRSVSEDSTGSVTVVRASDDARAVASYLDRLSDAVSDGSVVPGPSGTVSVDVLGRYGFQRDVVPRK